MARMFVLAALLVPTLGAAGVAAADPAASAETLPPDPPLVVGGFLGPHLFSQISALGFIDNAPYHPMLNGTVQFGARASRAFLFPWLNPEFELALAPTSTDPIGGADGVDVLWLEPRVQLRVDLPWQKNQLRPFALAGAGAPIALSSARKTIDSGIEGDGYIGAGARFDTGKGFVMRFDARLAFVPGVQLSTGDGKLGYEADFCLGVDVALDKHHHGLGGDVASGPPPDTDGDGIPDPVDKCPDRAEDKDGFQDEDGCPDIDNDGDHVLDIADKCPTEQETWNGIEDEDGCPDEVPADVKAIEGTVEGLLYASGETAVRDSARPALRRIAKVLKAHPTLRLQLVGHTDGVEAKAFAQPADGQPAPDVDSIAADLSRARAEAVRQALEKLGVAEDRLVIDGVGAAEPVADDATRRGQLANRRVEVKLFVENP